MPVIQNEDRYKIEILAKIIFFKNRTLSELENLAHTAEFQNVINIRTPSYPFSTTNTDKTSKICSVFYQYVIDNPRYAAEIEKSTSVYKKKNMAFLRNHAIYLEIQIIKLQEMPNDIARYILNVIELEVINDIIMEKELEKLSDVHYIDYFTDKVVELEKMFSHLEEQIKNSKQHFQSNGAIKSTYLKYCKYCIKAVKNELASSIEEYLEIVSTQIHAILKIKNAKRDSIVDLLNSKKAEFELLCKESSSHPSAVYIYSDIASYIEALILVYFTPYQCFDDLEKHTYLTYKLLNKVTNNPWFRTNQTLNAQDICYHVANKLFSPTIKAMTQNKAQSRNREAYFHGIKQKKDFNEIIASFRMPSHNRISRDLRLWDSMKNTGDKHKIKERIDVLSFFQDYVSTNDLLFILKIKFKIQKTYIKLLDLEELSEYCKITSLDIVGKARNISLQPNSSKIQHYDSLIMELILEEINEKSYLRRIGTPSFRA